jgi:ElaB/YqjD/DUF883 family membrane-anchored ribosome-binding protein
MDAASDLSFDHKQDKNLSDMPKNMGSNLHDKIDKVAEKAKPAIDSLAQSAHKNVERLAFRGGRLGDTYQRYLGSSRNYIQKHPLMSIGTAFVISYTLTKLLHTRSK